MSLAARKVPGYVLEAELGRGASGEVWRARVAATGSPVAVKWIPLASPEQARAARSEAAMLQALDHPHLVRLHDVVPVPDALALVLDLADGGTLAGLVAARGAVAPGEAVAAMSAVGAALAAAHAAGVVHGDVTPTNVLFTEIALPLLADLGVARIVGERRPARSTPAFVDPAVAIGGVPSPATDVFMAAGCTLFALTGEPLWPGVTADEALAYARAGRLDVAARLADPRVPPAIARVLSTALNLDPARRGTAAEFALELRHAAQPCAIELAAGRERPAPPPVVEPAPPREPGAHRPRHAAARSGSAPAVDTRARPTFTRPALDGGSPGSLAGRSVALEPGVGTALTHGVRARPVVLRPPRPSRRRRAVRLVAVALVVTAVSLGATVAVRAWLGRGHAAAAAAPATSSSPPPSARPTSFAAATVAALQQLAATRARAFAGRDAGLLTQVYVAGPLLSADQALLARIVPAGCGLVGAETTYSGPAVSGNAAHPVVTATAAVSASQLLCGGAVRGQAAASPAASMRIELVATANGLRISAIVIT